MRSRPPGASAPVNLRLFDTATRALRTFVPLQPGRVSIYVCGATVQSGPHIGHLRLAVAFDQLWRWLEVGHGYDVTMIRNITDLDDKVLAASREAGRPWWALAAENVRAFSQAYDAIGVRRPTHEPWATSHIAEMITFIERLVARGHAYRASDGSADVYFDVPSWAEYGTLTRQRPAALLGHGTANPRGKRDPRDFALWKAVDETVHAKHRGMETAEWLSPFGVGRPGWHLSCSTMIHRYLGEELDIHGGGIDLRFPHHENEQAQSHAAGYGFAQHWLHSGWVTVGGEKMGKSLGNSLSAAEMLQSVRPIDLRYYLGSTHYRSNIEFGEAALAAASTAMSRIGEFMSRAAQDAPVVPAPRADEADRYREPRIPEAFRQAMDDDLNVPAALAVVHATVREGNAALDRGDAAGVTDALAELRLMTTILGIDPEAPTWNDRPARTQGLVRVVQALVTGAIEERERARSDGDYSRSDEVRDRLRDAGVTVVDTPDGPSWRISGQPGPTYPAWKGGREEMIWESVRK